MIKLLPALGLILLFISGCKNRPELPPVRQSAPVSQEQLYQVNQFLVRQDATIIKEEARRRDWKLKETSTGLFYQLISEGKDLKTAKIQILPGMSVVLDFSLSLLDGSKCYSSKEQGFKRFVVEKTEAERGLHEAVQLFNPGDSLMLVVPPHLGYGLVGDGDKIPARAILVYHIKILSAD
jgi:FKBP-type peptidyl-prolyl cis-trans isomerase